jgi:hypothetical protein
MAALILFNLVIKLSSRKIPNFTKAMAKKNIPLFKIQQYCSDSGIQDFKAGSLNEEIYTAVEFEDDHRELIIV